MADHAEHHGPTLGIYWAVFLSLMFFTGLTVWVAYVDLGPFNDLVAMAIACTKATIVVLFFMHVKYASRLTWLLAGSGVLFLLILFAFTLADYFSRGWLGIPVSNYLQ